MSDKDIGRKMVEEEVLWLFLQVYEHVTGERLEYAGRRESQDFICVPPGGREVAVEITAVRRSPDERFADHVLLRTDEQNAQDALDQLFRLLEQKEDKRAKHCGRFASITILVLQII